MSLWYNKSLAFFISQEIASYEIKTLRGACHAAVENFVAEATRHRRRSSRASFFLVSQEIASYGIKRSAGIAMRQRKGILILSCEKERR